MLGFNLFTLLLCVLLTVVPLNAQPQRYNLYSRNNYLAYSGRAFGEGVLRPGYDQGEGYLDAPGFSAPSVGPSNYYG